MVEIYAMRLGVIGHRNRRSPHRPSLALIESGIIVVRLFVARCVL